MQFYSYAVSYAYARILFIYELLTVLCLKQQVLPESGHQLLQNYAELIRNWGWICSLNTESSRSFKK